MQVLYKQVVDMCIINNLDFISFDLIFLVYKLYIYNLFYILQIAEQLKRLKNNQITMK